MPSDPLVTVRHPQPYIIHVIVRPGADAASVSAALAGLPADAVFLDHGGDTTYLTMIFREPPTAPPSTTTVPTVVVPPAGWIPSVNGHRPHPGGDENNAVHVLTAGLLLGHHDHDILRPPTDPTRPTVLTVVRLVRRRADLLARPPHRQ
ncbi:hypothetical protein [Frankia sp. R82]|uniref:hypothetical protein n=1 Tax=Frankia sp. R82 TaxID=2950553 RepID=UPI002043BCAD|nr:hypothetical protein [Frankia sp. R82]MCM3885130.1 hypothetical protein [Frankia sp. R82]